MNAFTVANDKSIIGLIQKARRRLVVMAPAVSELVAAALIERLEFLGADAVTITLDVDAKTYRLGYGDPCTLDTLYEATRRFGNPLRRQAGLRISILISADLMMVYSPTPLLIEAGPKQENCPNAVVVGSPPLNVLREMGYGENGFKEQTIGLDLGKV